jgi:hypothetical protein
VDRFIGANCPAALAAGAARNINYKQKADRLLTPDMDRAASDSNGATLWRMPSFSWLHRAD